MDGLSRTSDRDSHAPRNRHTPPIRLLLARPVEVAFGVLVVGWLVYVLQITRDYYFWADDLRLIDQAGSWRGLVEPYNGHLSIVILSVYRAATELGDLSYTPFVIAGALSLVAVPVSYFVTTRRQLGAPLAAVLAMPLLWQSGMSFRPAELNHYLVLVGAMLCAAALNRGPAADSILTAALLLALGSAGGGAVVAAACLVHNLLVRPPLRRWLAVLVPSALWAGWWLIVADAATVGTPGTPTAAHTVRVVRDLCLSPFYDAAFGNRPVAYLLMAALLACGAMRVRRGRTASANFLAWTSAMVMWAVALVQSRGIFANAQTFRYAYLSLGFALLAVVPRHAISWPAEVPIISRRWPAAAVVVVLAFGGLSGLAVRSDLERSAGRHAVHGRDARATMRLIRRGPDCIPDEATIGFFGLLGTHGTAGQLRTMIERYGSPVDPSADPDGACDASAP